jgi:quercetin dioxygenase-like cupin family protein
MRTIRRYPFIALGLASGVVVLAATAYASVSTIIGAGTIAYYAPFGGPAVVTQRRLTLTPHEVLGWHSHPGIGAFTIVTQGVLTVEDGCGGEVTYTPGQAFAEYPNRIHRGKNLTADPVETVQTFVVPPGHTCSEPSTPGCGYPISVDECRGDEWARFTFPREFANQGDCQQFIITGR